jgi:hypothetical protein
MGPCLATGCAGPLRDTATAPLVAERPTGDLLPLSGRSTAHRTGHPLVARDSAVSGSDMVGVDAIVSPNERITVAGQWMVTFEKQVRTRPWLRLVMSNADTSW